MDYPALCKIYASYNLPYSNFENKYTYIEYVNIYPYLYYIYLFNYKE
nr:MAG TPA: hypothetical protein [Caudoviricetes sp.]